MPRAPAAGFRSWSRVCCTATTPARLPEVAGALRAGGACEVYADGGIRSGEDALAALGLGARAVFLGRPPLWALACGGADGVRSLLAGLTGDLAYAMALAGAASVAGTAGIARTVEV